MLQCVGSAIGPHPFPTIVRDFQSVIGKESRRQMLEQAGKIPDVVVSCVGGGSNVQLLPYSLIFFFMISVFVSLLVLLIYFINRPLACFILSMTTMCELLVLRQLERV